MSTIQDRGVVIRLSDYSETSQIVSLFTERHGLVRLIAKGIRRGTKQRFAAGVDLLEAGELSFVPARGGAGLSTLTGWSQTDSHGGLRGDLSRLYAGLYAAELLVALTEENDPHVELFGGLMELLGRLSSGDVVARPPPAASGGASFLLPPETAEGGRATGDAVLACVVAFQLELLRAIGYMPELEQCVNCGGRPSGRQVYFSSRAGGLLCRDCEMHYAEKVAAAPPRPGAPLTPDRAAFDLLDYHLKHVAGRELRMSAQLRATLPAQ